MLFCQVQGNACVLYPVTASLRVLWYRSNAALHLQVPNSQFEHCYTWVNFDDSRVILCILACSILCVCVCT